MLRSFLIGAVTVAVFVFVVIPAVFFVELQRRRKGQTTMRRLISGVAVAVALAAATLYAAEPDFIHNFCGIVFDLFGWALGC